MSTIILPKWTTANERLFGDDKIFKVLPELAGFYVRIQEGRVNYYQRLFGLTAKDTTGRVRTVVEGDVVRITKNNESYVGVVLWWDLSFAIGIIDAAGLMHWHPALPDFTLTILCHATEIVAAGNKLVCWECKGEGGFASGDDIPPTRSKWNECPTCHGEGQHEIEWRT